MPGNQKSRYVPPVVTVVMLLAVLVGAVACGARNPSRTAQPGSPVGVSPAGSPAPPPPAGVLSDAPSPAPATGRPKPSRTPARTAEGGFVVRPPGTGHGPASSASRTGTTEVALTFDDGPDPKNTPALLQVLRDNGVKATFCLIGTRVRDHPELVRQIYADGHTLCNHSWQHLLDLGKRDPAYMESDLRRTDDAIHAAVGADAPIKYFRAPGGNFTPALVAKARSMGMASIYWDVDPQDWNHKPDRTDQAHISRVTAQIKGHVRQGSIILSHDGGQPDTVVVYRQLVPWLKRYFTLTRLPV